jgi:hypothetical protein
MMYNTPTYASPQPHTFQIIKHNMPAAAAAVDAQVVA